MSFQKVTTRNLIKKIIVWILSKWRNRHAFFTAPWEFQQMRKFLPLKELSYTLKLFYCRFKILHVYLIAWLGTAIYCYTNRWIKKDTVDVPYCHVTLCYVQYSGKIGTLIKKYGFSEHLFPKMLIKNMFLQAFLFVIKFNSKTNSINEHV